jgi:hypothetical protein
MNNKMRRKIILNKRSMAFGANSPIFGNCVGQMAMNFLLMLDLVNQTSEIAMYEHLVPVLPPDISL